MLWIKINEKVKDDLGNIKDLKDITYAIKISEKDLDKNLKENEEI